MPRNLKNDIVLSDLDEKKFKLVLAMKRHACYIDKYG